MDWYDLEKLQQAREQDRFEKMERIGVHILINTKCLFSFYIKMSFI